MINRVPASNSFVEFSQPKSGYFLMPNSVKPLNMQEEAEKEKERHYLGLKISGMALVVGFLTMGFMRGFLPKGTEKYLKKLSESIEKKLADNKSIGKLQNFYKFSLGKIYSFIDKAQSVNNFTSLKDYAVKKTMMKRPWSTKIHSRITDIFEKIGFATVGKSYSKTTNKFANLSRYMDSIGSESAEIAKNKSHLNVVFDKGFGPNAIDGRYKYIKNTMNELEELFWNATFKDAKNFKNKDLYQIFVAEKLIESHKGKLISDVTKNKTLIVERMKTLLNLYEENDLSPKIVSKMRKKVNSFVKQLDKSIDTETNKFFDKSRDWKLGAAPVDVISIIGALGMIGYGLTKSDSRDERVSLTIKYGIPALGAIATSLLMTAKLIAGGKALVGGLVSGLVMNKMGVYVDNQRKKHKMLQIPEKSK